MNFLNAQRGVASGLAINGSPAERELLQASCWVNTGAFAGGAAQNVPRGAHDPRQSIHRVDRRLSSIEQGIDKERRNFIRETFNRFAPQATINFSIEVENGVALGHFTDLLHVEVAAHPPK